MLISTHQNIACWARCKIGKDKENAWMPINFIKGCAKTLFFYLWAIFIIVVPVNYARKIRELLTLMLSVECLWTNYIRMDGGRDRELYLEVSLYIHFFFFSFLALVFRRAECARWVFPWVHQHTVYQIAPNLSSLKMNKQTNKHALLSHFCETAAEFVLSWSLFLHKFN